MYGKRGMVFLRYYKDFFDRFLKKVGRNTKKLKVSMFIAQGRIFCGWFFKFSNFNNNLVKKIFLIIFND